MKAALVTSDGDIQNVIVWDAACIAPDGTTVIVVEDDFLVEPGWTYLNGEFSPPTEPAPEEP